MAEKVHDNILCLFHFDNCCLKWLKLCDPLTHHSLNPL